MKKHILVFSIVIGVLFLGSLNMGKAQASDCYLLYYNWGCMDAVPIDYDYTNWDRFYISMHKDSTIKVDGEIAGAWFVWGQTFFINLFYSTGQPLLYGKKKQGFMVRRDGSSYGMAPGCWYWEKVKPPSCPWISEHRGSVPEDQEDPASDADSGE